MDRRSNAGDRRRTSSLSVAGPWGLRILILGSLATMWFLVGLIVGLSIGLGSLVFALRWL
jgi:hypothetical protein